MAAYTFKVEVGGVDISDAVIAPFTTTHGRTAFTQGLTQWSANVSAFKTQVQSALTTAGKDPDFIAAGSTLVCKVYDTGSASYLTFFDGIITSTSADANRYQYSAIDVANYFWNQTIDGTADFYGVPLNEVIEQLPFFKYLTAVGTTLPDVYKEYVNPNYANEINNLGQATGYGCVVLRLPYNRTTDSDPGFLVTRVGDIIEPSTSSALSIDNNDIDKNYSTQRESSDLYNTIRVTYLVGAAPNTTEKVNQTSVDLVGPKVLEIDADFYSPSSQAVPLAAANDIAEKNVQMHGPGFAMIDLTSSADRLGGDASDVLEKTQPMKPLNATSVTAPEFQDYLIVQQVEHSCAPDYWQVKMLCANYRYQTDPQQWGQVTSNLQWGQVKSYLTWDLVANKDL